jgi:hypothetical protein
MKQGHSVRVFSRGAGELGVDPSIFDFSGEFHDASSVALDQSAATTVGVLPPEADDANSSLLTIDNGSVTGSASTPIAIVKGQRIALPVQAKNSPFIPLSILSLAISFIIAGSTEIYRREAELSVLFNISQDTGDTICGGAVGAGIVGLAAGAYALWRSRHKPAKIMDPSVNSSYGSFTPG